MKFSILVPVYNVEKYLGECVDSLLSQTYNGEYEIILVDDGSTDSSGSICDAYAASHPEKIKVIHKENGGHTSARLTAVKNASGDFCIFCDSDDFIENDLLESVADALIQNEDADLVLYTFNYYNNGIKKICPYKLSDKNEVFGQSRKEILYNGLISGNSLSSLCTKAVKLEILKNDPTDYTEIYKYTMAEDLFTSIYIIDNAKKTVYIDKPLYNYRMSESSITRSFDIESLKKKNTLFVYDRFISMLPKWGMDNSQTRKKLDARWFNDTMYTFSKYYENSSVKEKKAVLNYDWSSMLPETAKKQRNEFENKSYQKLYSRLEKKNFIGIYFFFLNKKIYKFFRSIKSKRGM